MTDDPVLVRRDRAARLAELGQRTGYTVFAVAIIAFLYGLIADFTDAVSNFIVVCLVVGSIVLAPAIVVGYAVKAAERDDIEHGRNIDRGDDR